MIINYYYYAYYYYKVRKGRELGGREVEGGRIKIGYDMICLYDMICMIYNNMICIYDIYTMYVYYINVIGIYVICHEEGGGYMIYYMIYKMYHG